MEAEQTRNSERAPGAVALRRTVIVVALLNLGYFGIEFAGSDRYPVDSPHRRSLLGHSGTKERQTRGPNQTNQ